MSAPLRGADIYAEASGNNRPLPGRTLIEGRFLGYTDMLDGNERGQNVPDVFLLVCSLAVFNGFHLYFSRSFCSFALVNKKKNQ